MMRWPATPRRLALLIGGCVVALAATPRPAAAQLKGLSIGAGQATVSAPSPTSTVIEQTTAKAIYNWQSYSIPAGASVTYQMPGSSSIALNRVLGSSPSNINGSLLSNGQVWLINPNGVLFGHGSQINVAGLLATTSDLRDQDFLAGNYDFGIASTNSEAAVVNWGKITTARGGSAVLAGSRVDNAGLIEADLGRVVLGGVGTFAVDFHGDKLLRFAVGAPVTQSSRLPDGTPAPALVSNSGTISAPGGKVLMTVRAARDVLDNVINSTGIVEATTASRINGEIVLDAGPAGTANVGGTLDASGTGAGETGGTIKVLGSQVALRSDATLDVSGDAGGGTILVGGNFHGAGPQPNASTTTVAPGARLEANALTRGNGGQIAVWSNADTAFAGAISARGGAQGGNGGVVETSSGGNLAVAPSAQVDTSAPMGATGNWLLDPATIVVASGGGTSLPPGGTLALSQDSGSTDTIAPSTIDTALTTTNVTLQASQDITVNNAISYGSTFTLGLMSEGTIHLNASIQNSGSGALDLVAGWDGSTSLASVLASSLASGTFGRSGGDVTIATPQTLPVAIGSAEGTTTLMAENLSLLATSGSAQLGSNVPGSTGDIAVALTGDLLLRGTDTVGNSYAQIGNGSSAATQGDVSGDIAVNVAGTVTLQGGVGPGGFAQIGNLGISSDAATSFIISGAIDVSAPQISLLGGVGANAYAQIGNGRFLSGQGTTDASASSLYGGDITVTATQSLALQGNGPGAYAQIGNGGEIDDFTNTGAGLTEQGNISVTVGTSATSGTLTLTAGTKADGYAQIGNGGSFINSGQFSASNVSESGTITVSANGASGSVALAGNTSVANAYAQIGNGDASGTSAGNVSGDITLAASQTGFTGGALVGNATDNGTISGTVNIESPATISGTVFSDRGLTVLPDALVGLLVDGISEGTVTANASGVYDFSLAAGTIPSSGAELLAYLLGTTKGNSFEDGAFGSVSGLDIYGNYLRVVSGKSTLSAMVSGLATALGSNSGSSFLFSIGSGNALNLASAANLEIDASTQALALDQAINAGSGALVLNSTGTVTQSAPITAAGLDLLGAGGSFTLTNASNSLGTVAADTGSVNLTDGADLRVGSVAGTEGVTGTGAITLVSAGNLTLDAGVSGIGNAVTLATGGAFTNDDGSGAVDASGGRWLIYSQNPANDASGGLAFDFRQYGASYPTAPTPSAGNGFLYTLQPILSASLIGTTGKTYDGTTAATLLAGNYAIVGVVGGDTVTLNDPSAGTYASPHVGTGIGVDVSGLAITSATNGTATVYGYTLASASAAGDIGTITPASLSASLTGTTGKTYDGTTVATLSAGNYMVSGLVGGDTVTLNDPTSGSYASPHVGTGITVTVSGLAITGTGGTALPGDYTLASTSAAGNIGSITPASLSASLTGTVSKTYDGTTAAMLSAGNYAVSGLVGGDTVTLNDPSGGTYASPHAGTGITVTVSGLAITGTGGAALPGDYTLASTSAAGNIGSITPASLSANLTGTVSKTYDGTTAATLSAGNYAVSGLVSGDTVTLNDPTSGSYVSPHVGTGITVSVSGLAIIGTGGTALPGDYTLASTSAAGNIGTITPAGLTVAVGLTGTVSKTYDGTTAATLSASNYMVSGLVGGDTVTLNDPTSGSYASPHVGTGITVTVSGLAIIGTGGTALPGDYTLASTSAAGNIGSITPASVTVGLTGTTGKTYDGTTAAMLSAGNYAVSGLVGGDTVTLNDPTSGSYASPHVGTGITVSVSGLAIIGTGGTALPGDYALASTSAAGDIGSITPASLSANLTGTVSKTYDGTTAATLSAGNYMASGLVGGDTVTLNDPTSGSYASPHVGTGITVSVSGLAITGTGGTALPGDYTLASTSAAGNIGSITPATLSYVADSTSLAQGAPVPGLTGIVSGFVSSDNQNSATTGTLQFATSATAASDAGSYPIEGSGLSANYGDYVFAQAPGNAAALTITGAPPVAPPTIPSSVNGALACLAGGSCSAPAPGDTSGQGLSGGGSPNEPQSPSSSGSAGNTASLETAQPTDSAVLALDKFKLLPASTRTIISGLLTEALSSADSAPQAVPPADQDYSSWGNEALWQ